MANLKKILLVDDDEDLREALSEQLVMTEEFDVFEAGNGAEAMQKVKEQLYDLVILDVGLPDTDGRELCRVLRKHGVKCPVLMLTGHDSDADTILGLDAGANDYVTKPFKFPVLLARIRAQLRTHEQSEDAVFQLGPYTFKPSMKMLITDEEKKIRLTEKETNILFTVFARKLNPIRPMPAFLSPNLAVTDWSHRVTILVFKGANPLSALGS